MPRDSDGFAKLAQLALGFHWKSRPFRVPVLAVLLALDLVESGHEVP
jgi:hypothetical protein